MEDQPDMSGMVEMLIIPDKKTGKVIQRFQKPMIQIDYDPENVIGIACAMTDAAFEIREGHKPASDTIKSELIERHRKTLTKRIEIMIKSMREEKKVNHHALSKRVVEACLKEIFS